MNAERLVTMANQIEAFFASQGDREEATSAIADHPSAAFLGSTDAACD